MPSNKVRGAITQWVTAVCELPAIRYGFTAVMLLNLFYFYFVMDALLHPFYDLGFLSPLDNAPTCESKVALFRNERNAYITGFSLFMFLVLRRLIDIQSKLHQARSEVKATGVPPMGQPVGVPMGQPVPSGKSHAE
uniref:BAP29/BAP31 transmembrane domain-containing protein n=1 Tax=Haptolina ericina TaxID=156174 RepID=A0A7S3BT76_9EUKA|mmetsp:Transcript_65629/g.146460  ORF Transcript_65629/g.146460 Transcript_65629/m.146460 type:complete len:136 (+) Transcript_65629:207-614(+)|eukprot:CAMPEP_0181194646 /NCGR_PEP_ID=MMETSP1096-20121128/14452_1 /TAXON_ID=156174 ORGANISM="Chrysochromulina ericina, Strain CCMP281" /NCGR_SAMPLE_ID=MMETSP1096 /ASSEMBLY_ACC=CAM_ASM_000453 /LENGTH=135 /DNA_ID=CAMNT_0023284171 /DNA_START=207 /DNA_END=614 /DNA_ORIENTATION=-